MTLDNRRYITAWWIFYMVDRHSPEKIKEMLEYVEGNIQECDQKLASIFTEYIPQI